MLMRVPPAAVVDGHLPYGQVKFAIEDGTADVPRWMVPDLEARGCTRANGSTDAINTRAELEAVPHERSHELSIYLNAHGKPDHYFNAHKHPMSDKARELGSAEIADELDNLFQQHHAYVGKGRGMIKVMDTEERRTAAIALFDRISRK